MAFSAARHSLIFLIVSLYSLSCFGYIQAMIEDIEASDFVFERSESQFPFLPVSSLQYIQYPENEEPTQNISEQAYSFDQFLMLPVWVGKKNMVIVSETLSSRRTVLNGQRFTQNKSGLILGWMQQANPQWQWGAFTYIQYYDNGHSHIDNSTETLSGALARYRHSGKVHSWYGLVYDTNGGDGYWLPYVGLEWMISPQWMLSFIPPWPSISYISDKGWITRFGILPGQTRALYSEEENVLVDDFSYWSMGLTVEKSLNENIWVAASTGYSGFGKFTLSDDQISLKNDLDSTPFFKLSLNFRPK
ncbi:MAG: hypothetical protein KAG18_05860 [Sinobacterium sp.]|nr:hypothetical protein [Sinobacterium sp.]